MEMDRLTGIARVTLFKQSRYNYLVARIILLEDLFHYRYCFRMPDLFELDFNNRKLSKYENLVRVEFIKTYSSIHLRKEFNITQFLDNYPSVLSNQHKRQIKEHFIQYLKVFHQEGNLQDKVLDLSSNKVLPITDLNSTYSQIAVFENIKVQFL